jgi:hypothetical protein
LVRKDFFTILGGGHFAIQAHHCANQRPVAEAVRRTGERLSDYPR